MENQNRWDLYNQFALWGDLDRFTKFLTRFELYKLAMERPGDIVECGVLKGAGVLFWAKLVQIFNPLSPRKVIGFDTFEGYTGTISKAIDTKTAESFHTEQIQDPSEVTPDAIMAVAEAQGLSHRIQLVKGDASITIPQYMTENPGLRIALLNLDFVLYDPTLAAMKHLYPRVVTGGVVVLDEYAIASSGESDAVDEIIEGKRIEMKSFSWARSPTAFFLKE